MANTRVQPLSGTIDGVNTTFTTPENFVSGTFRLFLNGALYRADDDKYGYSELDSSTVTLTTAPRAGDVLQGIYDANLGSASPGSIGDGVQNTDELRLIPQAAREDRQLRLVEDENALYRFEVGAVIGGETPVDVDDGRWFKVGDQLLTASGTPYHPGNLTP